MKKGIIKIHMPFYVGFVSWNSANFSCSGKSNYTLCRYATSNLIILTLLYSDLSILWYPIWYSGLGSITTWSRRNTGRRSNSSSPTPTRLCMRSATMTSIRSCGGWKGSSISPVIRRTAPSLIRLTIRWWGSSTMRRVGSQSPSLLGWSLRCFHIKPSTIPNMARQDSPPRNGRRAYNVLRAKIARRTSKGKTRSSRRDLRAKSSDWI